MLQLTGKLRYRESNAYDFVAADGARLVGTAHKARVEVGRGKYIDVKVRETDLGSVPDDSGIPEVEGLPVSWEVEVFKGQVVFLRDVASHAKVRQVS